MKLLGWIAFGLLASLGICLLWVDSLADALALFALLVIGGGMVGFTSLITRER